MVIEEEARRLVLVLHARYAAHLVYCATSGHYNDYDTITEWTTSKRPLGTKGGPAVDIAYQLGWDVERRLCREAPSPYLQAQAAVVWDALIAQLAIDLEFERLCLSGMDGFAEFVTANLLGLSEPLTD